MRPTVSKLGDLPIRTATPKIQKSKSPKVQIGTFGRLDIWTFVGRIGRAGIRGVIFVLIWAASNAAAQQRAPVPASSPSNTTSPTQNTNAPRIVREANRLLLDEKPAQALDEYQKARALRPDAREIAFGEGLAHYRLGEYDQAREAFNRASGGVADRLADDALYSLGTCDHSEALAAQDPKAALGKLENAMRNYQSVLADRPDHPAAKDANLKAASYWRQLKQQLQQQQQQQQQNSDQNKDQQQDDEQQQQNADQNKDQPDKQQQEQNQNQDQQSQQQQQQQQAGQDQKQEQQEQKEQQQQSADKDQEQKDQQMQKQQAEKEDVSREQAERKLREMMQALRDRKKVRREEIKSPPYRPSEKDW
jgi:TolA-binding protein